jgi:hypothetical protein
MAQRPGSPVTPRVQKRAPALMPLLIGAGVGCAFGAFVGYSLEEGEKVTRVWTGARACASGGALGALIGWVVSSR